MKKVLLLFLFIGLTSCFLFQENGIIFKIENNSDFPITNIKFTTTKNLDSITFDKISPNDFREDFLSMKHKTSDGSYTLSYIQKDSSIVETGTGYYTNGGSMDSWIRFEINNDTTTAKFGTFPE